VTLETVLQASLFDPHGGYAQAIRRWSPYLTTSLDHEGAWLQEQFTQDVDDIVHDLLHSVSLENLRQTKKRLSLLVALCDLSQHWGLNKVTNVLSTFADIAIQCACESAYKLVFSETDALPLDKSGFFVLCMGKLGAFELNYSSDIDLIFLYDSNRHPDPAAPHLKKKFVRLTREIISIISDITQDGYVFRTDIDLRPNPSSTPICMSTTSAQQYYESYGRTWERAAFIKARVCPTGDQEAGQAFLSYMTPFIWRKHLDYAAIEDAYSIINRIRDHRRSTRSQDFNLKLDRGGIREIEFFAQTHQLIRGGRHTNLRCRATCDVLKELAMSGFLTHSIKNDLEDAYVFLRSVEHRAQMILDSQTHVVRHEKAHQQILAEMSGFDGDRSFFEHLCDVRESVCAITEELYTFEYSSSRSAKLFDQCEECEKAEAIVAGWFNAGIPATRSPRAESILKRILPQILEKFCTESHEALQQFDRLLQQLPSGVQVFSLFEAEPALFETVARICTDAPFLVEQLAKFPTLFDLLLYVRTDANPILYDERLYTYLKPFTSYEKKLDAVRRWAREERFSVALKLLLKIITTQEAASKFSSIAQAVVKNCFDLVCQTYDQSPDDLCVVALGRLGSQEMTYTSDLDIIIIYNTDDAQQALRWTRRFISALTVQTAEGALYDVDMRLRPSGRAGPVAVHMDAFSHYHQHDAWTWEHLALTRARCICGSPDLSAKVDAVIADTVGAEKSKSRVWADTKDMYEKVLSDKQDWKTQPGGLTMLEFCIQASCLIVGLKKQNFADVLDALQECSAVPCNFKEIWQDYQSYLQIVRILNGKTFAPDMLTQNQKNLMGDILERNESHIHDVQAFFDSAVKSACGENCV
jgi:glutamate-ammonia-ligase adenylyltransferase